MKIKPVILDRITTKHTNYVVDLQLESNVTFITGDSGTGKSAVYSFLQEYSSEDKRVRCFNYLDNNKQYKKTIKASKGKLFVIDNADILLDDNMRRYIAMDPENQYIIIGVKRRIDSGGNGGMNSEALQNRQCRIGDDRRMPTV